MSTPTPPPPPGQPDWPASAPATSSAAGGRQPWWTGGRIALAVVIVLVLMGGAGFAGFLAGMAVGGFDALVLDDGSFDFGDVGEGFDGDVPGVTPLDAPGTPGPTVRRGEDTAGTFAGQPVDHPLTLASGASVTIELSSDDFDAVLVLLDGEGTLVASDDDGAGAGTDSLLELDLDPGSYTVRVQSWGGGGSGAYVVRVD